MLKFSIITVCYNSEKTIENTIKSVLAQDYPYIEYLIVDGASTDSTISIIEKYKEGINKVVSERDRGIYDAINKGIALAQGDIVCLLNSDDVYADERIISRMAEKFEQFKTDSLFAFIDYVNSDLSRVIRKWRTSNFSPRMFFDGTFPPHPSFMVKREIYERYGLYRLDLPLASDFELMLRLLVKEGISTKLVPEVIVKMSMGGASNVSIKSISKSISQCYKAFKINNINRNLLFIPKTLLFRFKQLL